MLEEALQNENHNPNETAAAMLQFVQVELPAGAAVAEARFLKRLFTPLCDRIFGEMIQKDDYRHKGGGWLSASQRWSSKSAGGATGTAPVLASNAPSAAIKRAAASATAPSWERDPVVELLGTSSGRRTYTSSLRTSAHRASGTLRLDDGAPQPTLIEAISNEMESRPNFFYSFPFLALPQATQQAWLAALEVDGPGIPTGLVRIDSHQQHYRQHLLENLTENSRRLLHDVIRTGPRDQRDVRAQYQKTLLQRQNAQRSPLLPTNVANQQQSQRSSSPLGSAVRMPAASSIFASPEQQRQQHLTHTPGSAGSPQQKQEAAFVPHVQLDMLEYYLMLFLRYPLAAPQMSTQPGDTRRSSRTQSLVRTTIQPRTTKFGDTVYCYLFRRYLYHFLPYGGDAENRRSIDFLSVSANPSTGRSRASELFLRLTILLWLESQAVVTPTAVALEILRERRLRAQQTDGSPSAGAGTTMPCQGSSRATAGLATASEFSNLQSSFALVHAKYKSPSTLVKRSLYRLVEYLILDPSVSELMKTQFKEGGRISSVTGRQSWSPVTPSSSPRGCMSTAMSALQQPFYNYIRCTFRHALLHGTDDAFYAALEAWLLWLEPWNLTTANQVLGSITGEKGRPMSLSKPKFDASSRYNALWQPYIAANLYVYTVPLAIFLRRARELDFSAKGFEYSVRVLKRVFRVFSSDVLSAIATASRRFPHLVSHHMEMLGPYGPPQLNGDELSLSTCRPDMLGLLEEIYVQRYKKLRELGVIAKSAAWIEGFFGKGVVSGEEKNLEGLVERAKLIVDLPPDFEVVPSGSALPTSVNAGGSDEQMLTRTSDGMLTLYGRRKALQGEIKCSPEEVSFIGDPMHARVNNREIHSLVQVTVFLSEWLNKRFGLDRSSFFRFNLRFLSESGNLLWTVIAAGYLFWKLFHS